MAEMKSALRRGLKCEGDMDVRTRLILGRGQVAKDQERENFLRQAVELNGNLTAAAIAKLLLRRFNLPN